MSESEFSHAVALLDSPEDESLANALLSLGITHRPDLKGRIEAIWLASAQDSDACKCAMLALQDLGGASPDLQERLIEQYRLGHHKFATLQLLAIGEPEEVHRMLASVLPDEPPFDEYDQRIISMLGQDAVTRHLVARQIDALVRTKGHRSAILMFDSPRLLDPHEEAQLSEIWHTAATPNGGFTIGGTRAASIERLSEIDPEAAYEMATYSIKHEDWDRDRLPGVMLRIDPALAMPDLMEMLLTAPDSGVCRKVALQLRENAKPDLIVSFFDDAFASPDKRKRRAATFAAGFLRGIVDETKLAAVSLGDQCWAVCRTAASSLRAQQRESEAVELIRGLKQASSVEAWGTAFDIIRLADPGILWMTGDPLGFRGAVVGRPFTFRKVIAKRIEDALKKADDRGKSASAQWGDDR